MNEDQQELIAQDDHQLFAQMEEEMKQDIRQRDVVQDEQIMDE